jgi:hypothetical protein
MSGLAARFTTQAKRVPGDRQQRGCKLLGVTAASLLGACGEVLPTMVNDVPVTVTVLTPLGDGAPDLTARVLFQDPEGGVVSDVEVDAMGHAQSMLPQGGTVSAIRVITDAPDDLVASIASTVGVRPGDDLTFGLKANATVTNQGGQTTMTATFPTVSGASTYTFYTPCGLTRTATSPVTLSFRDSCHGATFDLLGTTLAGTPAVPMFLKITGVNYESNGSFSIPAVFSPMDSFTVHMMNVPDAVSSMSVSRASMNENLPVVGMSVNLAGDPPAGDVSVSMPYPQSFGTRSELSILMSRADAQMIQRHEVHTASLSTSATVDLGRQQLPWFTDLALTATGATWTMVAPGDPPDGMMTRWSGSWSDGSRPVSISWLVAQPADMAGMTLPRLPAIYSAIDPGQQTVPVTPRLATLYMVDYDNLTGYDELRTMPETLLTTPIGVMGAFVGLPFQRRLIVESTAPVGP